MEHYACAVVGLLSRSGCLQEAAESIRVMSIEADEVAWGVCYCLNACWFWKDIKLDERVVC